jgi:glycosyltransferase A (GT-A) superfamily protein (DUF2064 family)
MFWIDTAYFNDFFRYLWDGAMSAQGIHPFQYIPDAIANNPDTAALAQVWYWDQLFFKWTHTIYGPTLQHLFHLAAQIGLHSGFSLKTVFFACNIGTLALTYKILKYFSKPTSLLALIALSPLWLFETLSTAHVEAVIVFGITLSLWAYLTKKHITTGISYAALVLTKYFPLVVFSLFLTQRNWKQSMLILLSFFASLSLLTLPLLIEIEPALLVESLKHFQSNWVMSPGLFAMTKLGIEALGSTDSLAHTKTIMTGIFLFWCIATYLWHTRPLTAHPIKRFLPPMRQWTHDLAIADVMFFVLGGLLATSSVVFSWYVLWLIPLIPFIRYKKTAIVWSLAILSQYTLVYFDAGVHQTYKYLNNGELLASQLIIWLPVFVTLLIELVHKKQTAVVFYARIPEPDMRGKTRLGRDIRNQDLASSFARAIILDMINTYAPTKHETYDLIWYYSGNAQALPVDIAASLTMTIPQHPYHDLSMDIVHKELARTYHQVVIVGSDIPKINKSVLKQLIQQLSTHDIIMAPTHDGGYGLIGANGWIDLYHEITNWESRSDGYQLAQDTRALIKKHGYSHFEAEEVFDIDYQSDVKMLWQTITDRTRTLKPEYQYLQRTYSLLFDYQREFGLL